MDVPITRSQAVKALKSLISVSRPSPYDTPSEIFHFGILPAGLLEGKSDRPIEEHRSIVLVMSAVLDQALEGALLTRLPGIKAGNEHYLFQDDSAPLRDFDSKIRLAFALELIGEGARSDLSLIRTIRNTFAHSRMKISFQTPAVIDACNHFTLQQRKPQFVDSDRGPCQIFINVGYQYALNLIVFDEDEEMATHRRSILDIPQLSPGALPA